MSCQGVLTHLVTDVNMYRLSRNPQMHLFATKSWNKPISEHLCICLQSCLLLVNTVCEHHWIFYLNWHLDWQTDQDNNIKDEACHFCIKPNCKTNRRLTESFFQTLRLSNRESRPQTHMIGWVRIWHVEWHKQTDQCLSQCFTLQEAKQPTASQ